MKHIYLDNAATTKVAKEVFEAMKPYFDEEYGNPSSMHDKGIKMRKLINETKKDIAKMLNCNSNQLIFTSCGTEATNLALKGIAFSSTQKAEIITTKIEHHATLNTTLFLEKLGFIVHYLDVDNEGFIDINQLQELINNDTLVVSIILANNEIGTIQNINEIAQICKNNSIYLHVDAVQALCHIPIDMQELNADFVSFSGHKFHAPKGIGMLYVKEKEHLESLLHGGAQEYGKRAGTENVPYIVGFHKALSLGIRNLSSYKKRLNQYSTIVLDMLNKAKIDYRLNGPKIGENRLPGNLNISFPNIDGSELLFYLNKQNVFVSTGSACDSTNTLPSHVLRAIKVPDQYINGSIRISIGNYNTKDEVIEATKILISLLPKLN